MSRPRLTIGTLSVLGFALLLVASLAAPAPVFAFPGKAKLQLAPKSLNFGNVAVGTTSAGQTVTATNLSDDDTVRFLDIFVTPPYRQVSNTCDGSLGAMQSCQVDVACKPRRFGPAPGALVFVYSGFDQFFALGIVPLNCKGVRATPTPTPTSTSTSTSIATPTATLTATNTATATATRTATATATPTSTATSTATGSKTPTATAT
jgi:hypothetical protein